MQKANVNMPDWFQRGFELYTHNFPLLLVSSVIACLLSTLTLWILAGPLFAGLILICLRLHDGSEPKPAYADVFKGFDVFVQSLLFVVVWSVVLIVGSALLSLIPGIGHILVFLLYAVAQTVLLFAMFLIADRYESFLDASMRSARVVQTNFFPFLGLALVTGVIGMAGAFLCGIGAFFTVPISICILTVAYRDVFTEQGFAAVSLEAATTAAPAPEDVTPPAAQPPAAETTARQDAAEEERPKVDIEPETKPTPPAETQEPPATNEADEDTEKKT